MAITSIVDYLKSQGQDSSYAARKQLAAQAGITNYSGTAAQNMNLLTQLQKGSQASPGWERQRKHHLRMFSQEQVHPDPRVRFLDLLPPLALPLRGEA